jgi:CelD/BcsL family acetyltransferase involved in cellulose biosynthesis
MFLYVKNSCNKQPRFVRELDFTTNKHLEFFLPAPFLQLPETKETLIKSKSRKFWYNIRRSEKKSQEALGRLNIEWIASGNAFDRVIVQIFELYKLRWRGRYTRSPFVLEKKQPLLAADLRQLIENGEAEIGVLYFSRRLVGAATILINGSSCHLYGLVVDPSQEIRPFSVGKIILKNCIFRAVDRNFRVFDFMVGDDLYKNEWTSEKAQIYLRYPDGISALNLVILKMLRKTEFFLRKSRVLRRILNFLV